ncbi:glycosyltransferase family 4 protein [Yersinia pseudotuberculosis]|uniref:WbzI n=1 Tax=Yersinia similis TaxID=367190 RepID=K4P2V5_9GAMM|nr:glycosyltransferase family 4 protein [Yersinia pseudotuberculosis]AFV46137.1 WbzI [Yersinia similis]MBO1550549.1 glycosyltransferase [Yersinia pseudotuberculosis]MBO1570565.1 glycosyltransferase [Yersinia pseudotuberculosis]MBO1585672.1 glycosyltransferase [Yersinia pseudotuberculosis]MBO1634995.1 glycosyltransferase [Yersinia pseudotuberculosis]
MKIAMITPSLRNVGPVKVALDIITELVDGDSALDISFTVFYLDEKVEVSFPCQQVKLTWRNILELYDYDVIHSHMLRPDLLNSLLPFYKGMKISTIHNIVKTDLLFSHGKTVSFLFSNVWKLIWKGIHKKVVLTNYAKKYYSNEMSIPLDEITVINNGVKKIEKPDSFSGDLAEKIGFFKEKKYIVLGSVALFNDRKGLEQVIKLLVKKTDYAYVIIGDGPSKNYLKKLAEECEVSNRVFFSGFMHNGKDYIYMLDCYMMPSREEGFPLALTEAISTNVVTVCSDIPVFKEILDEASTSYFALDDINSLSLAVERSISNRVALSASAYKKYCLEYTREIMAKKYVELYMH